MINALSYDSLCFSIQRYGHRTFSGSENMDAFPAFCVCVCVTALTNAEQVLTAIALVTELSTLWLFFCNILYM